MAGGRVEYVIGFTGDTRSLENSLNKAVQSLQKLGTASTNQLTTQMREASNAALDLSLHLQNAFNQKTGSFDLINFNNSLKKSNMSLEEYAAKLSSIGPTGEKAFLNVAQAISKAELPLKRSSKLLDDLWISMKNTMKWQLTSSAMHGFMSAVSTAYRYTQDLNESLTSIQIVTNKNSDEMARFAEQANKAAQSLSTTTNKYAQGALIYYQQGDTNEEVEAKTATTIKLANVAGESAEKASEQLTAIWNNFYDGSKSLEYYADVMTALGAATASSTEEISQGVQKFAAVSQTVGLSYEYATAALATITATTRESADIVGNSLKTLFARIQGLLQDGEAEDGTSLNKYSQALANVGISIKDASGEMKGMNVILDEMGTKWNTLSQAQQLALAQTVAGVRQYSQLIALMENWDFFQSNLGIAEGAEGTLEKQAQIYAKSWEAARDRVRASAEAIYDSLINEDFFIDFDNKVAAPFLNTVANIIDGLGGMKGVLQTVGYLMLQIYGDRVAESMRSLAINLGITVGLEGKRARELQAQATTIAEGLTISMAASEADEMRLNALREEITLQGIINEKMDGLNASQQQWLTTEMQKLELLKQARDRAINNLENQQEKTESIEEKLRLSIKPLTKEEIKKAVEPAINNFNQTSKNHKIELDYEIIDEDTASFEIFEQISKKIQQLTIKAAEFDDVRKKLIAIRDAGELTAESFEKASKELSKLINEKGESWRAVDSAKELNGTIKSLTKNSNQAFTEIKALQEATQALGLSREDVLALSQNYSQLAIKTKAASEDQEICTQQIEKVSDAVRNNAIPSMVDWAEVLTQTTQSLFALSQLVTGIQNIGNIFSDDTLTAGEQFLQLVTSIVPALFMTIQGLSSSTKALQTNAGAKAVNAVKSGQMALGEQTLWMKILGVNTAVNVQTGNVEANTVAWLANPFGKIIIVLTALISVITIVTTLLKKQREAQKELNEETMAAADATKEELKANQDLQNQMEDALATYKKTGDNKEDLDGKTRELAQAYGVEGSAIAELTGQYEDYEKVLDRVNQKKYDDEIKEALKDTRRAQEAAGEEMFVAARQGSGYKSGNTYNIDFKGAGRGGLDSETNKIFSIYQEGMSDFLVGDTKSLSVDISDDNYSNLLKLYDALVITRNEIEDSVSRTTLKNNEFYKSINEWINKMAESVEKYRQYVEDAATYEAELGKTDLNVSNLKEYDSWVEDITKKLNEAGITDKERQKGIIDVLVGDSSNPDLSGFKKVRDAVDEIKDVANVPEDFLEEIFSNTLYDPLILATLNWGAITEDTWEDAYNAALKYKNAIAQVDAATENATKARDALDIWSENMDASQLKNLYGALEWGKNGIIDFTSFLQKSSEEQQQYLRDLVFGTQKTVLEGNAEAIEETKGMLKVAQSERGKYDRNEIASQKQKLLDWETLQDSFKKYKFLQSEGKDTSEVETTIKDLFDTLGLGSFNPKELGQQSAEEYAQGFEEYFQQDKIDVQGFDAAEERIDSYKQKIVELKDAGTIELYIAVEDALSEVGDDIQALEQLQKEGRITAEVLELAKKKLSNLFDKDVNVDQWKNLANWLQKVAKSSGDLADSLEDDRKAAEKTSAQILRYDSAIQKVSSNYDDWMDAISNGNLAEQAVAFEEMSNAYNDLLDIPAGFNLSEAFLLDPQNLQLFLDAASGVSEAYDELAIKAANDLALQFNPSLNAEQFYNDVDALLSDINGIDIDDLEVGAELNDEGFLEALGDLMTAAGFTAQEAEAYLSSIGIDAEVEQTDAIANPQTIMPNIVPKIDYRDMAIPDGSAMGYHTIKMPYFKYEEAAPTIVDGEHTVSGFSLKVKSAHKSSGGGFKYRNAPSVGSGKKSGGGGGNGGGSGSTSEHTPAPKKNPTNELNRYHELDRELTREKDLLDDLSEAADRAYGANRVNILKKSLKELYKEQEINQKKLDEAENRWLPYDTERIKAYFTEVEIKPNGELANFEKLERQMYYEYNTFIDKYNEKMSSFDGLEETDEIKAEKEEWEEKKQKAEEELSLRQELLDQYEQTRDTIQEIKDEQEEINRLIADNKLMQVELRLEYIVDVKNMRDIDDQIQETIAESFGDALQHAYDVAIPKINTAQNEIRMGKEYAEQFAKLKALYEDPDNAMNREQIIADMKELQSEIQGSIENLVEYWESIEEVIPNALDAASKRYAEFTDQLANNSTVLDTIKELYALQGVTYKSGKAFDQVQKASSERARAIVEEAKIERARADDLLMRVKGAELQLSFYKENDPEYDSLKAAYDAYLTQYNEANQAALSLAKEGMEATRDLYLDELDRTMYEFEQVITNGMGFDFLQEKYDHYIDEEERYLDKVNEAYQVTTWYNKLQADIDKTTDAAARDRLQALKDEIDLRRANNTLSQYDLDVLEAKYKVTQAQMELEEAQNNKTQLRLVRDRQGNWNYQYTADPNAEADKQKNLADAQIEWYNITKKQVKDINKQIIDMESESAEKLAELEKAWINKEISDEEYEIRSTELREYYSNKRFDLERQYQEATADMTEAGNANLITAAIQTGDAISDLTGITSEDLQQIVSDTGKSLNEIMTADKDQLVAIVGEGSNALDLFENQYAQDLAKMTTSAQNYQQALNNTIQKCEQDYQDYADKVNQIAEDTGTKQEDLADKTEKVAEATDKLVEKSEPAIEAIKSLQDAAEKAAKEMRQLGTDIWNVIEAEQNLAKEDTKYVASKALPTFNDEANYMQLIGKGIVTGQIDYNDSTYQALMKQREEKYKSLNMSMDEIRQKNEEADKIFSQLQKDHSLFNNKDYFNSNKYSTLDEWLKQMQELPGFENFMLRTIATSLIGKGAGAGIIKFDSGGYTGEFNDAKLAFLHEKELVLNENDTKNILEAVDILKESNLNTIFSSIEKAIDRSVVAAIALMSEQVRAPQAIEPMSSLLEQSIHIDEVNFEGATTADEIKEAFRTIANDASQWALRRRD